MLQTIQVQGSLVYIGDHYQRGESAQLFRVSGEITLQICDSALCEQIYLFFYKGIIFLPNGNGRTIKKLAVTALTLGQGNFRFSAFGDICRNPCYSFYLP